MVYNAQMIRFRPHIYIYKVYFIKGHFCPPAPLEKGQGGKAPLSDVPGEIRVNLMQGGGESQQPQLLNNIRFIWYYVAYVCILYIDSSEVHLL